MAKIKHIAIATQDPDKTAKFYIEVFGLREIAKINSPGALGYHLTDGDINLAILKFKNDQTAGMPAGKAYTGLHHIGFLIDDMKEVTEKVESNGAKFHGGILGTGSGLETERKYTDPNGVNFDITMPEYARDFWKIAVDGA